jgi:hypothetical protein
MVVHKTSKIRKHRTLNKKSNYNKKHVSIKKRGGQLPDSYVLPDLSTFFDWGNIDTLNKKDILDYIKASLGRLSLTMSGPKLTELTNMFHKNRTTPINFKTVTDFIKQNSSADLKTLFKKFGRLPTIDEA